jgi:hypothetical protein
MAMVDDRASTSDLEPREPTVEHLRDMCRELNKRGARYVVVVPVGRCPRIRQAGKARRQATSSALGADQIIPARALILSKHLNGKNFVSESSAAKGFSDDPVAKATCHLSFVGSCARRILGEDHRMHFFVLLGRQDTDTENVCPFFGGQTVSDC